MFVPSFFMYKGMELTLRLYSLQRDLCVFKKKIMSLQRNYPTVTIFLVLH
jgi:hypothetical protein